ncbi:MAG: phospholipase D-like domain-containing protein [Candidatus Korarchaeota archaeon]
MKKTVLFLMIFFSIIPPLLNIDNPSNNNPPSIARNYPDNVVITEVMADPLDSNAEYFEIANPTNTPINITNWNITDLEYNGASGVKFNYSIVLSPGQHIIVARNASAFYMVFRCWPDYEYYDANASIQNLERHYSFELSNTNDELVLFNNESVEIDVVKWGSDDYNGNGWNGSGLNPSGKHPLVRIIDGNYKYFDTNTSSDWRVRQYPSPGKPNNYSFPVSKNFVGEMGIECFVSPDTSFSRMKSYIQSATTSIYLMYYEFYNPWLVDEIVNRISAGVTVRAVLESNVIGHQDVFNPSATDNMTRNQVWAAQRLVDASGSNDTVRWADYYVGTTHAKVIVVDNKSVCISSANFVKTGYPPNPTRGNREWGVIIHNPEIAKYVAEYILHYWSLERAHAPPNMAIPLEPTRENETGVYTPYVYTVPNYTGTFSVTISLGPATLLDTVLDFITSSSNFLIGDIFYIDPNWTGTNDSILLQAICNKSSSGISTYIVLDGTWYNLDKNNISATILQQHGARVALAKTQTDGILAHHVKGIVADNNSVLLGSMNWNKASSTENVEIIAVISSTAVAEFFANITLSDLPSPCIENITYNRTLTYNQPFRILFDVINVEKLIFSYKVNGSPQQEIIQNESTSPHKVYFDVQGYPLGTVIEFNITGILFEMKQTNKIFQLTIPDGTPPEIEIKSITNDSNSRTVYVRVRVTDISTIVSVTITYSINNGPETSANMTYIGDNEYEYNITDVVGKVVFYINAVDEHGNARRSITFYSEITLPPDYTQYYLIAAIIALIIIFAVIAIVFHRKSKSLTQRSKETKAPSFTQDDIYAAMTKILPIIRKYAGFDAMIALFLQSGERLFVPSQLEALANEMEGIVQLKMAPATAGEMYLVSENILFWRFSSVVIVIVGAHVATAVEELRNVYRTIAAILASHKLDYTAIK